MTTDAAGEGPVDIAVRPCAWLREQRGEYEGPATLAPLMFLGDTGVRPHSALHGATYEPLYSAAALADAVAAERERCARLAVAAASAAVKKYEDDPTPVRQPYANNRLIHVGWDAADLIRGPNVRGNREPT